MYKSLIFHVFLGLLAASCGNKSTIKSHIESRSLGDGENITFPLVVPLSEKAISSFESPVPSVNPLLNPVVNLFVGSIMGIGASIGAGKQGLTLIQPIPRIPENYISSIKIKRILFFMEPTNKESENFWKRLLDKLDPSQDNFKFLRRLAVKVSSTNHRRVADSWEPVIIPGSMDKKELSAFSRRFRRARNKRANDWDKNSTGFILIDYNQDDKLGDSLRNDNEGGVINIIKTDNPYATRKYLEDFYGEYLDRIHTLSRSIIVELKSDRVVQEMFRMRLSADAAKVAELGIGEIAPCERTLCLDFKMKDKNLMPILNSGNAVKIDTYIDPKKVPKGFQLKGFIEFEVKIKSVL